MSSMISKANNQASENNDQAGWRTFQLGVYIWNCFKDFYKLLKDWPRDLYNAGTIIKAVKVFLFYEIFIFQKVRKIF